MLRRCASIVLALSALSFSAYAHCVGKQRWDVKSATDAAAADIDDDPVDTTIAQLNRLERPDDLKRNGPRTEGSEQTVYTVEGTLIGYLSEADHDRHLVLRSRGKFIVAELADPGCVDNSSRFFVQIREARQTFDDRFRKPNGKVPVEMLDLRIRMRVTGVGFFDARHNVSSAAENFMELHPVIAIEFLDQ